MSADSVPTVRAAACSGLLKLLLLAMLAGCALAAVAQGSILCDCLTPECREEGETTCRAAHYCYSETVHGVVSKGCIDDSSPLLCENRKPQGKGIDNWPALSCCNHRDFCNRDVTPRPPLGSDTSRLSNEASDLAGQQQPLPPGLQAPEDPQEEEEEEEAGVPDVGGEQGGGAGGGEGGGGGGKSRGRHDPLDDAPAPYPLPPCQSGGNGEDNSGAVQRTISGSSSNSGGGSKVINPIYIAVPVAGVCVLLALVIFAMYLLRRRQHHHHFDNYHHYHDHLHHRPPNPHHYPPPPAGGGGGGHHHHHLHGHPHPHHQHLPKTPGGLLLASAKGGEQLLPGGGGGSGAAAKAGSPGGGNSGGSGSPLYGQHHHHLCDCVCQKTLPACAGKLNRCTDSERTSSGSETKLFLQA